MTATARARAQACVAVGVVSMSAMLGDARSHSAGETLEPPPTAQGADPSPVATMPRARDDRVHGSEPTADRVWIEIDPAAEPIAGVLRHGSEPARPFSGWLELVALLESERGAAVATPSPPTDPG